MPGSLVPQLCGGRAPNAPLTQPERAFARRRRDEGPRNELIRNWTRRESARGIFLVELRDRQRLGRGLGLTPSFCHLPISDCGSMAVSAGAVNPGQDPIQSGINPAQRIDLHASGFPLMSQMAVVSPPSRPLAVDG
jgi:hypothetical protein